MDPVSVIILVIGIVSSIAMTVSATIIIIKNGKDITDNIVEFFRGIGKKNIIINKMTAYPAFAGVCKFFEANRRQIVCNSWVLITLSDATGKPKTFALPAPGRYIEIELQSGNKILIRVISDNKLADNPNISGFVIYYENSSKLQEFANTALKQFLTAEDLQLLIGVNEAETIPNVIDDETANLLVQQGCKSEELLSQVSVQEHHNPTQHLHMD